MTLKASLGREQLRNLPRRLSSADQQERCGDGGRTGTTEVFQTAWAGVLENSIPGSIYPTGPKGVRGQRGERVGR